MDISVLGFYGYIGDKSIFINYSKFKYIFNLYIKTILKVHEMKIFHLFFYRLGFSLFFIIINDRRHKNSKRLLIFLFFLYIFNDRRQKNFNHFLIFFFFLQIINDSYY